MVGEDRQEPQVVAVEAVQAELRKRDHADGFLVVLHRDNQHRFVDVFSAGDRLPSRIAVRVVDQQRLAMLCDPAGEALAEAAAQQVEIDVLVGADPTLEGDRHDLIGQLDEVHARVVVVDDPAGLLDECSPDRLDRCRAVESTGRRLENGQLRGLRLGLLEQLGVGQGDRGMGRERRKEGHVAVGPFARLARHRRQRPDHAVVMR